jgi:hypothetical protein
VAINQTGEHMAAVCSQFVFTSGDYGISWNTSAPQTMYSNVAMDSTEQYLGAITSVGILYASSNYGEKWTAATNFSDCDSSPAVAISGDASQWFVGCRYLYTSRTIVFGSDNWQ